MPFCSVAAYQTGADAAANNAIKIFYKTYGHGPVKVLMIIGLAGTHDSWGPQIKGLTGSLSANDVESPDGGRSSGEDGENGVEVCAFDNRGVGQSSVPMKKTQYTTSIMAKDAIALMDHLGWKKAHVFGHSMGAMIACKLAAMVPDRVLSLALLNVTGGGYECLPKIEGLNTKHSCAKVLLLRDISCMCETSARHWKMAGKIEIDRETISIAIRFLRAKTPEQRAAVDLDTHYSKEYLEENVGDTKRRAILYQQYVKGISSTGMQSSYGLDGQMNACWTHNMSQKELESICSAGFPISVIHGRHDIIAQLCHARRLAQKLFPSARMVELPGAHLVSHERTKEVNEALSDLIKASEQKISLCEWTNLPEKSVGWGVTWMSSDRTNFEGRSRLYVTVGILEKLYLLLVYIFGLLLVVWEHVRRAIQGFKPHKVGATLT